MPSAREGPLPPRSRRTSEWRASIPFSRWLATTAATASRAAAEAWDALATHAAKQADECPPRGRAGRTHAPPLGALTCARFQFDPQQVADAPALSCIAWPRQSRHSRRSLPVSGNVGGRLPAVASAPVAAPARFASELSHPRQDRPRPMSTSWKTNSLRMSSESAPSGDSTASSRRDVALGGSLIRRSAASGQSEESVVPSGAGPQTVGTTSNAAAGKPWKPVPVADPTGALLPRATSL